MIKLIRFLLDKLHTISICTFVASFFLSAQLFGMPQVQKNLPDSLKSILISAHTLVQKADALNTIGHYYYDKNPKLALEYYLKSKKNLQSVKNRNRDWFELQAAVINNIGYIYYMQGAQKKASLCFRSVCNLGGRNSYLKNKLSAYNNLGLIYIEKSRHYSAILIYRRLIKMSKTLGHPPSSVATYLNNIGYIFLDLKSYKLALSYLRRAEKSDPSHQTQISIDQNLGVVYFNLGFYNKAELLHLSVKNQSVNSSNYASLAKSLVSLGKVSIIKRNHFAAKKYLQQAVQISEKYNFTKSELEATLQLIKCYPQSEIRSKMVEKLRRKEIILQNPLISLQIFKVLLNEAYKSKKHEDVFKYHKQILSLQKQIQNKQQKVRLINQEVYLKNLKFEQKRKLSILKSKQQLIVTCIILVFLFFFVVFLIFYQHRLNYQRHELYLASLEKNQIQILSYNLEIQAKTQAFQELKTLVKSAQENPFLIQEQLQTLYQKTKEQIRNENSWSNFQIMFQKLDRKFMDQLTKQFPSLSENEIRLCCLMRMNIESSEIIKMLNISKNTLKSARFRIHKKMNLPAGTRLIDFLLKM